MSVGQTPKQVSINGAWAVFMKATVKARLVGANWDGVFLSPNAILWAEFWIIPRNPMLDRHLLSVYLNILICPYWRHLIQKLSLSEMKAMALISVILFWTILLTWTRMATRMMRSREEPAIWTVLSILLTMITSLESLILKQVSQSLLPIHRLIW